MTSEHIKNKSDAILFTLIEGFNRDGLREMFRTITKLRNYRDLPAWNSLRETKF